MREKENREVIQSWLITSAKYTFTADEKRVLSHLVEMMQPLIEGKKLVGKVEQNLWGDYHFQLPTSFFLNEAQSYTRIKNAFIELNKKSFEYEDDEGWEIIRLVEMPKVKKRGEVEFYLSPKLVEIFLNFNKGYSKYMLDISLSFKSVYSMRLYELISNQQAPITFSISKLKEMWDITEKSYQRNNNFFQKVIDVAKKELDEKSNWSFDYKPIKKGRSFKVIEFTPIHYVERETEEVRVADAKRQVGLSYFVSGEMRDYLIHTCGFTQREIKNNDKTIKTFCEKFSHYGLEKIREIWGRARNANNPKGYFIKSLQLEIENN